MLIVAVLFFLFTLLRYKQTVLFTAATIFFLPSLASGIGEVKLLYIVCLFQILCYYGLHFNRQKKYQQNHYPMHFWLFCTIAGLSHIVSNIVGVSKNLGTILVNIACFYWYPFVVWKMIGSKKDLHKYLQYLFLFFSIVFGYAFIELIGGYNIYSEWANNNGIIQGILGGEESGERFGLLRCNSILPYSSTLGMTSAFIFYTLAVLRINNINILQRNFENLLMAVSPFMVFLSGTRSQMVVFAILALSLTFNKKFWKSPLKKYLIVGACLCVLLAGSYLLVIADSIIHSDDAQMGSSSEMRMNQLEICLLYWAKSPIWGNGKNYIWDYVRPYHPDLYGAESQWFQLLVDYGLIGCITYLLIAIGVGLFLRKFNWTYIAVPFAFIVGKTLSIVIGIEISFLLVVATIISKLEILYGKAKYPCAK